MLFSALLIDITGGRIETHFYVFGALALLAFYRDWRVLIIASAVVAIHHGVFGVFAPQNIYGVSIIQPWRWVQHTAWVVFEDVFLIISITQSLKEMMGLAERQASLETVNARIEQQVDLRTGELERSRTEALHNLEEAQQARGKAETAEQELLKAIKAAEASEARLRRRDAMFRQLFDAVPDLVTVSRLGDGKFIEVNAEFLRRSGLSRGKALTTSTLEIGQWVRPEERNLFVQKLKADGHVRELEVDFLLQGVVVPYLASSDAGADLHVSKPIKKATLLAAIESVVPAAAAAPPTALEQDHEAPETDAAHRRRIVA